MGKEQGAEAAAVAGPDDDAELSAEVAAFAASFRASDEAGQIATQAVQTALAAADAYCDPAKWSEEDSKAEGTRVFRRPEAAVVEGAVAPFKTSGVVTAISPLVLGAITLEKLADVRDATTTKKRKEECRVLQQV